MIQIIGKGGFSREVQVYINKFDAEYIAVDSQVDKIRKNEKTIIAIGDPIIRRSIAEKYPNLSYVIASFITPYENYDKIGVGTIICPGTIITSNVKIGKFVIINLNCTIGHDCVIGDFVTISPGANISGNVYIGDNCYIGSNAVIREGVKIGNNVTIGAGAIIVKDITEPGIYVNDTKIRKL